MADIFAKSVALAASMFWLGTAAQAAGDTDRGRQAYKMCAICHSLEAGRRKAGPDLNKVIGRRAGTAANYGYSRDYIDAGKKGLVWTPEILVAYLKAPRRYIAAYLKKDRSNSRMSLKYPNLQMRQDIAAYLASLK